MLDMTLLEAIGQARTIAELDALVPEIRALSEPERAALRIPWRAARELMRRLATGRKVTLYPSQWRIVL
jgi:hypothetical protein